MVVEKSEQIIREVDKVLLGKEDVIRKVLMTIYAGGHILLEDYPGVGKTTLAVAFSKVLDLNYKRVQFTPDTMPSDITGFSVYDRETGEFTYKPGAADCNLLLGDEINRSSARTQSALLEVMEEGCVTVDGITHPVPNPFICIATQNPVGSAGTQALPDSQLDRFMVRLSIGYPDSDSQIAILEKHRYTDVMDSVKKVISADDLVQIQHYLSSIKMTKEIMRYMISLCETTRENNLIEIGVSPRGILALASMARARAIMEERDFVIPEDVQDVFPDVCTHRLILKPQARIEGVEAKDLIASILAKIPAPTLGNH